MKLKIKGGEINAAILQQAFADALRHIQYSPENELIKSATVYFNLFDRETGAIVTLTTSEGVDLEELVWLTPEARKRTAKRRAMPRNIEAAPDRGKARTRKGDR